jgi:imidazoleglycerol phosphate synthase glutamine amidotransferase subunit HisH
MTNKNIEIIKGILNTQLKDEQKIYFIQSYLLNWTDEEEMKRIIESNKEESK